MSGRVGRAPDRGDDGVDDQLADVGDAGRQHAGDERQERERELSARFVDHTSSIARRL